MKKTFENFLRLKYGVPILIAATLVLAIVGELAYQRSVSTLRYGIALTEARIGSAHILQLLTDAESARRGYLLTDDASYLEPVNLAERELGDNKKVFDFISGVGPTGPKDAQQIYELAMEKLGELEPSTALVSAGDKPGALALMNSGAGKQKMEMLRTRFKTKFDEASSLQTDARTVIYGALMFNRIAVLLMSLMIALGMYWYWRRLRQVDLERHGRHKLLETEVTDKTSELRTLAGYLLTVREDEKSRLARELHDELGGLLTAAKLNLARMRAKLLGDVYMLERIEQINLHLNGGIALKRRIVEDLRPSALVALGLAVALPDMCTDAGRSMGTPVKTNISVEPLPPDTELGIYRIVQEALTNIGKYAQPSEISVELRQTAAIILLNIQDNGCGFDLATLKPGQHGLAGMRFRVESLGGTMNLISAPGAGTKIAVRLPPPTLSATPMPALTPALAALA
jgi:signal transduction histidine kinase